MYKSHITNIKEVMMQTLREEAEKKAKKVQGPIGDEGKSIDNVSKEEEDNLRMQRQVKIVDEEVQQIDELSKDKLNKYIDKAIDTGNPSSISNLASKAGYELGSSDDPSMSAGEKEDKKAVKRSKYVLKAVKKVQEGLEDFTPEEIAKIEAILKS